MNGPQSLKQELRYSDKKAGKSTAVVVVKYSRLLDRGVLTIIWPDFYQRYLNILVFFVFLSFSCDAKVKMYWLIWQHSLLSLITLGVLDSSTLNLKEGTFLPYVSKKW